MKFFEPIFSCHRTCVDLGEERYTYDWDWDGDPGFIHVVVIYSDDMIIFAFILVVQ